MPCTIATLKAAAMNGHMHCVRSIIQQNNLIIEQSGPTDWCEVVCNGHLECLRLLLRHGAQAQPEKWILAAAESGQIVCLKYLLNLYPVRVESIAIAAVNKGHVRILQCAIDQGCVVGEDTWKAALVASPNVKCLTLLVGTFSDKIADADFLVPTVFRCDWSALEVLHQRRYHFPANMITEAAKVGNLAGLQFLHRCLEWDCWAASTIITAVEANQAALVKALHHQGCPWDETAVIAALRADAGDCFRFFLEERGVPQSAEYQAIQPGVKCKWALNWYEYHLKFGKRVHRWDALLQVPRL